MRIPDDINIMGFANNCYVSGELFEEDESIIFITLVEDWEDETNEDMCSLKVVGVKGENLSKDRFAFFLDTDENMEEAKEAPVPVFVDKKSKWFGVIPKEHLRELTDKEMEYYVKAQTEGTPEYDEIWNKVMKREDY